MSKLFIFVFFGQLLAVSCGPTPKKKHDLAQQTPEEHEGKTRIRRKEAEARMIGELVNAAAANNMCKVKSLLAAKVPVDGRLNADSPTPVLAAASSRHLNMVKFLIAQGADVNNVDGNQYSALCLAARNGDKAMLEALLAVDGVDINNDEGSKSPLEIALHRDHLEIARILVDRGAEKGDVKNPTLLAKL